MSGIGLSTNLFLNAVPVIFIATGLTILARRYADLFYQYQAKITTGNQPQRVEILNNWVRLRHSVLFFYSTAFASNLNCFDQALFLS